MLETEKREWGRFSKLRIETLNQENGDQGTNHGEDLDSWRSLLSEFGK